MTPTKELMDVVFEDDKSLYENVLLKKTFHSNFSHADFVKYYFQSTLENLEPIMQELFKNSPEECAQDIYNAYLAIVSAWEKLKNSKGE